MITAAVAGASGYAGGELLRILSAHPGFELIAATAHGSAGERVGAVHPHLRSLADVVLADTTAATLAGADVVFLALPHGASGEFARQLDPAQKVVDLGADFR
ncbi:MAG: N-acetyl-gamma-glutamyl-phosphate reductase, partial [Frankiaceae bacterium]|nr:N-acetyl-gamma-glutamyl-phosphate reductase [Frankiaceae bacterium]